jgi:hypothetical protein
MPSNVMQEAEAVAEPVATDIHARCNLLSR